MSSVWVPMLPVEPSTTIRLGGAESDECGIAWEYAPKPNFEPAAEPTLGLFGPRVPVP
jgi:hypothetical protein